MAAPCRRCGSTKTEPTRRGLRSKAARLFGYDLRSCSRCRRLRLLSQTAKPYLHANPAVAGSYDPDGFHGCPRCGMNAYELSARNWFERTVWRRPPMARCRGCGYRFPFPQA